MTTTSARALETAAIDLAAGGYHVFPCKPRRKEPLTVSGFKNATVDERTILHWWDRRPDANVGVACGASGIVVLDIDSKQGADPREIISRLGLTHQPIVWTGEAGPPDAEHPNSLAGVRGAHIPFRGPHRTCDTTIPGVELRGNGSYVIAPPSVHPSGVAYAGDLPATIWLSELPKGVLEIIPVSGEPGTAAPAAEWLSIVRDGVAPGRRNKQLARLVGHLLRRWVDVRLVAELAHLVNTHRFQPPLPGEEVDRIIDSITTAELLRRGRA